MFLSISARFLAEKGQNFWNLGALKLPILGQKRSIFESKLAILDNNRDFWVKYWHSELKKKFYDIASLSGWVWLLYSCFRVCFWMGLKMGFKTWLLKTPGGATFFNITKNQNSSQKSLFLSKIAYFNPKICLFWPKIGNFRTPKFQNFGFFRQKIRQISTKTGFYAQLESSKRSKTGSFCNEPQFFKLNIKIFILAHVRRNTLYAKFAEERPNSVFLRNLLKNP